MYMPVCILAPRRRYDSSFEGSRAPGTRSWPCSSSTRRISNPPPSRQASVSTTGGFGAHPGPGRGQIEAGRAGADDDDVAASISWIGNSLQYSHANLTGDVRVA